MTLHSFGMADFEHAVANTPETIFEAGSVSKQFTAAAILPLARDGKLRLNDDIRKYLPEMSDYGSTITIDHLITPTSGLRDWGVIAEMQVRPRTERATTQADVLDLVSRQRSPNYAPASEYDHTNSGYNLMAIIVGRVSVISFGEFSRQNIFAPLRMTSTSWRDDFRRVVKGRAIAYLPAAPGYREVMPFEDAIGMLTAGPAGLVRFRRGTDGRVLSLNMGLGVRVRAVRFDRAPDGFKTTAKPQGR